MARLQGARNNTYAIHYDFSDIDADEAIVEFTELCSDLTQAGLSFEVRPGDDESLLVFARAPKDLLRAAVYDLRVKDWLYGITSSHPDVSQASHGVDGQSEAEDLLSMYHLVNWSMENGGAGITPGKGKWKNVKSIFPIHNDSANTALLGHLSRRVFLTERDLDQIRDLFGVKVAFYFAYMQTYLVFLSFPAVTGIYAWLFLPSYSLMYAIVTLFGCTVFLEYWKIRQANLSIRWNVRGVGHAKVTRVGHVEDYSSRFKHVLRQLLQFPFFVTALLCLGVVITCVFGIEILISEVYEGTYSGYLQYLPTILLAISLPYINSFLEDAATSLAEYENHRTQDEHDMSLAQKRFVLSFVANYLPIFLTAFVYVPMGDAIIPYLETFVRYLLGRDTGPSAAVSSFQQDPDRLRNEVIALTVTGQVSDMFEELILPYLMTRARAWYKTYQLRRSQTTNFAGLSPDAPAESKFLENVRRQACSPQYDVQDDISEMVIQYGYLALFSPVWPLISIGFLINNWIELRSDFLKICIEHQRPHPIRLEGIGPWISSLETLTLLGSITTGAIVHMFGVSWSKIEESGSSGTWGYLTGGFKWWTLPVTILVSEHVFLVLREIVRFMLQGVGSDLVRKEREDRYARRKRHWDGLMSAGSNAPSPAISEAEPDFDLLDLGVSGDVDACQTGTKLIKQLKDARANSASMLEKMK
jgi:anoctamin-10